MPQRGGNMKKKVYDKYMNYNLPEEVMDKIYSLVQEKENTIEFTMAFEKAMDNYIVSLFKTKGFGRPTIISKYNYLKVIVAKNPKYQLKSSEMDKVYMEAIDMMKYRYNEDESMSYNILNNMRAIINTKINGYDVKFLKEYLSYYKEDRDLIIKELDINNKELDEYLNGKKKVTIDEIETICLIYDVDNYEELSEKLSNIIRKKKIEIMTKKADIVEEINNNNDKKYRVTFLKKYLEISNIPKEEMAKYLEVNMYVFDRIIDGTYVVNTKQIEMICEFFNVNDFEELKNKIISLTQEKLNQKKISKEPEKEVKEEIKPKVVEKPKIKNVIKNPKQVQKQEIKDDDKLDMSFMKEYVEKFNYSKKKLSELWHCGIGVVDKILDGYVRIREDILWETYTEFHAKDYEDLKIKLKERIDALEDNLLNKKLEEEKKLKIQKRVINLDKEDKEKLFNLLNIRKMNYRDNLITILLFGGITDKTVDEISDFLQISKVYIMDVYKRDLEELKRIYKGSNDNIKLIYKDREVD